MTEGTFDRLPLLVLLAATALLFFLFHEAGFRLGRRRKLREATEAPQVSAIMAGVLGLLALMLAFTFNMAGTRFDARKQAVLDEANAISTTWLRSRMLPSPHPEAIENLLAHYVAVRLEAARSDSAAQLEHAIAESKTLHERLWRHAETLGRDYPRSVAVGLFVESLNDVIDLHEERVSFALRYRISGGVWFTLYFIAFSSLAAVGAHAGLKGSRNPPVTVLLVLTLSVVLVLVFDLDRVDQTLFSVSQDALIDLSEDLQRASVATETRPAE